MKILSTTLLISFMTVFAASANAAGGTAQQANPRLANCKDCIDAGYRRGYAEAEAKALENTPAGSSSVTTPLSYRKPVYVQAPSTRPQVRTVKAPVAPIAQPRPRKLPSYVQRMEPRVQPTVPNMKPKRQPIHRLQQAMRHAGHGHHTQAQMIDCELTDSLNNNAGPVTTVISTQKYYRPVAQTKHHPAPARKQQYRAPVKQHRAPVRPQQSPVQHRAPARMPAPLKPVANYKHGDHYHHTSDQRADCELTDRLNRGGTIVRVVRKH